MDDYLFMRKAIDIAKLGIAKGQTPFGACIVKDRQLISCNHNLVWKNKDISAHAEIQAIRSACRKMDTIDLSGATIYSTCEPCPMCFSACHWARISRIVYGAKIGDAMAFGFRELTISNKRMRSLGRSSIEIVSGLLKEECLKLFSQWQAQNGNSAY